MMVSNPTSTYFFFFLKACGSISNFEHGRALHLHARDLGRVSNPFVVSSLLSMFGKCGSLRFFEEVFHEFPQHCVIQSKQKYQRAS
ncbi:hypothetical protein KP509_08G020900 [Ceratopteris richardii]|uniref:Pentatricopeptide repeat-containing protein n=1 Tax=Ceratopteris richardii TaxID=49495 RepID=A0A8T2UAM6_CERRI|nr:hypothetical protein KP509_08G020900 [Ceratopteris richardii]